MDILYSMLLNIPCLKDSICVFNWEWQSLSPLTLVTPGAYELLKVAILVQTCESTAIPSHLSENPYNCIADLPHKEEKWGLEVAHLANSPSVAYKFLVLYMLVFLHLYCTGLLVTIDEYRIKHLALSVKTTPQSANTVSPGKVFLRIHNMLGKTCHHFCPFRRVLVILIICNCTARTISYS